MREEYFKDGIIHFQQWIEVTVINLKYFLTKQA